MTEAERVYAMACGDLARVRTAIDRLHELRATEQLRLLIGRMQRLIFSQWRYQ
jgi:hypothetical protein